MAGSIVAPGLLCPQSMACRTYANGPVADAGYPCLVPSEELVQNKTQTSLIRCFQSVMMMQATRSREARASMAL